jgi:hypothetical protein
MFQAANAVTLDVLAAVCRKDHEDRRRRQAEGQVKAEAEGSYRDHSEDRSWNDDSRHSPG